MLRHVARATFVLSSQTKDSLLGKRDGFAGDGRITPVLETGVIQMGVWIV